MWMGLVKKSQQKRKETTQIHRNCKVILKVVITVSRIQKVYS